MIAVSGSDTEHGRYRAAGLRLVDTRTWSMRTIDGDAMSVQLAGDTLLTTGWSLDEATKRAIGIGVVAYGIEGEKHYHLFDGHDAWVALVLDGRAYVDVAGEPLRILDLSTGRVVGTREQPLPTLLFGTGAGWWD